MKQPIRAEQKHSGRTVMQKRRKQNTFTHSHAYTHTPSHCTHYIVLKKVYILLEKSRILILCSVKSLTKAHLHDTHQYTYTYTSNIDYKKRSFMHSENLSRLESYTLIVLNQRTNSIMETFSPYFLQFHINSFVCRIRLLTSL